MQGRLQRRIVVVTGAGSGIGAAIARRASREGAAVACLDVDGDAASEVAAGLRDARGVRCDVTDLADVEAALADVVARLGPVDALVNSAGGSRGDAVPFLDLDPVSWHAMIDRNLTGSFHCGLVYARHLADRGGGAIVLISSQLSLVTRPGLAHYAAAKGAVAQLVKGMAVDLAPVGVRVNAVAPGPTHTAGNAAWFDRPDVAEEHARTIPLGRVAQPDEIAGAAVHLLSDDASFTTGATMLVDGGYTLL